MTFRTAVFSLLALFSVVVSAGCGVGSGTAAFYGQPVAASPTIAPTAQFSLSNGGTTTEKVSAGNATASLTFPEVQATGAILTLSGSSGVPSGVAPLLRSRAQAPAAPAVLAYVSLNSDTAFTLPATPRFTFALPTPQPGSTANPNLQYYVAYLAPNASSWVEPLLGPGVFTAGDVDTVVFPVVLTATPIAANQNYSYALYSLPAVP